MMFWWGMNHRMVLAALGAPENKIRDQPSGDPNGGRYEEWIYGMYLKPFALCGL